MLYRTPHALFLPERTAFLFLQKPALLRALKTEIFYENYPSINRSFVGITWLRRGGASQGKNSQTTESNRYDKNSKLATLREDRPVVNATPNGPT